VIVPVACALPGSEAALAGSLTIDLIAGTRTRALYGRDRIETHHFCSFEVNPDYRAALEQSGMRTAGLGPAGEVRAVELAEHPFFVATLFQPQRSSRPDAPDQLVTGFVVAALTRR
jgi:CTP synthase